MRWMTPALLALVAVLALTACTKDDGRTALAQQPETQQPDTTAVASSGAPLSTVRFARVDGSSTEMQIEVADTPELEQCGLMHRLSMPENQAMLFVMNADTNGAFWNGNTFIPLTLAWIAADGTIVALSDMPAVHPDDDPQINSFIGPTGFQRTGVALPFVPVYRYVIEANRDWFTNHNVAVGDRADLSSALARGNGGAVPICREKGFFPKNSRIR